MDPRYNLIVIRILGEYVNFRARKTAANKLLVRCQIKEICKEIWMQIFGLVGSNFMQMIMVILRTNVKDYPLDVVLYPLCDKIHETFLRRKHGQNSFPEILTFVIAVLFYKHWILMFTMKKDLRKHVKKATISLDLNFTTMPVDPERRYSFIRLIDDRIRHTTKMKRKARYEFTNINYYYCY